MRLWDYEEGGEIGQNGFVRGEAVEPPAEPAQPAAQEQPQAGPPPADARVLDVLLAEGAGADEVLRGDALAWEEILAGGVGEAEANRNEGLERPAGPVANGGRVVVAQEGPLVLRLDMGAAPGPRRDRAEPQQQVVAAPAARQQRQRAGGPHRNHANPGIARQHQQQQQQYQRQQQIGQRGRGGRGRGTGRRDNQNQHPNQGLDLGRRQQQNNQRMAQERAVGQQDELQAQDAAWIRHFVHLALEDNEHLIDLEEDA